MNQKIMFFGIFWVIQETITENQRKRNDRNGVEEKEDQRRRKKKVISYDPNTREKERKNRTKGS